MKKKEWKVVKYCILIFFTVFIFVQGCKRPEEKMETNAEIEKQRFLIDLCGSKKTQFGKVAFEQQNEANRVFSCIWELEMLVHNGGFRSYYESPSTYAFQNAEWAYEEIGAFKMAEIIRKANSAFPNGVPPSDQKVREKMIAEFDKSIFELWERLESEFYDYPDNTTELLYDFVKKHKDQFSLNDDDFKH